MKSRAVFLIVWLVLLTMQASLLYRESQRVAALKKLADQPKAPVFVTDEIQKEIDDIINRSTASNCATVHEPQTGCPHGYVRESSPSFTERDGSKRFACWSTDSAKEPCTDFLLPGEGFDVHITIPVQQDGDTRPRT